MENTSINNINSTKTSRLGMLPAVVALFFGIFASQYKIGFIPVILVAGVAGFITQRILVILNK